MATRIKSEEHGDLVLFKEADYGFGGFFGIGLEADHHAGADGDAVGAEHVEGGGDVHLEVYVFADGLKGGGFEGFDAGVDRGESGAAGGGEEFEVGMAGGAVNRLEPAGFEIAEQIGHQSFGLAHGHGVHVGQGLFGELGDVQAAHDHADAPGAELVGDLVGPLGARVHGGEQNHVGGGIVIQRFEAVVHDFDLMAVGNQTGEVGHGQSGPDVFGQGPALLIEGAGVDEEESHRPGGRPADQDDFFPG